MEQQRRLAMLSNSTSATSLPDRDGRHTGDESTIFIKQLQQQLRNIRNENEELGKNITQLRKRIHELEEDKVAVSCSFNKENANLQAVVAQLEANVERGEAARQILEYDLAVAKRKVNDVIKTTTHKEVTLSKENIQLTDDKSSLELKIGEMENELIVARQLTTENEKRIAFLEQDKRQMQTDNMTAEALLRSEKEKLANQISELSYQNEQLTSKLDDAKQGLMKQEEDLRRLVTDLQISVDREQHLRHDLEEVTHRAHSLEESVEAERAAHLESKFNSEIIQLKQQEFESQLGNEREVTEAYKKEADESNAKFNEMKKQLEFERHQARNANAKLEKTVQVYADVRKQLDEEINFKSHVIEEMTSKLDEHQEHLNKLKEELSKAKKRMAFLEETQNGNIGEIELLLETFCLDTDAKKKKENSGRSNKSEQQETVFECLKKTLFGYQKKIVDLRDEVENMKSTERQTQKDCDNFRDLALAREKSMQQAQQELSECGKELEQIRVQQAEYERETAKTCHDLEEVTSELEQQTERCQHLEENVNAIQDRHSNEIEVHVGFLRELHHVVCSASGEKNSLTRFMWSDLSITIREATDTLINMFQRSKEKATQLERSCEEMQRSISELERAHESSVDRLAGRCRERDEESTRQRKQLEQHYEALLAEMHSRTLKTQTLCDEAWERLRSNDGIHDGLHAECAQLRGENSNLQQERKALACAGAMLFGALYPTLRARDELAQQRSLLARINNDGELCKQQMRILVDTLNEEMMKSSIPATPRSFRYIHPLIRFRVGVICVLAANRLKLLTNHANIPMFSCDESAISNSRIIVVAGKTEKTFPRCKDELPLKSRSAAAVDWLSDVHMIHAVRDATCGVVDAVAKKEGDSSGYMSRAVIKTAKNAFFSLMESTHSRFPCYTVHTRNIVRERRSLCRVLSEGLDRVIHRSGLRQVVSLFSVEHSFSALQRHLLNFTERLHAAEVEKRNLRNNEASLRLTADKIDTYKVELEKNEKEMKKFKDNERHRVSRSRFESVCSELHSALGREKQAQKLLDEQNGKLQVLSRKFEEECTTGVEKEITLTQAVTSLTEVKMELKRCSQNKRQLEKQVEKLQLDKKKFLSQVNDAKNALKKAAGEKNSITDYFTNVEHTMQLANDDEIGEKLRMQSEEMSDRIGPGMKAAKRAVESFVRAQSSAVGRINNLESQIASYRTHISALKRELHNACHRENEMGNDSELPEILTRNESIGNTPVSCQTILASTPYGRASEFKPMLGEIMEQPLFENMNGYRSERSCEPTKHS